MRKLRVFHTRCCRSILGITMWEVAMYSVTNENVLRHISLPPMDDIVHYRRLTWMGKLARMSTENFPRKFLNAWADHPRSVGRRQYTTRDSYLNSLKRVGIDSTHGLLSDWLPLARDGCPDWKKKLRSLKQVDHLDEVEFFNTYL